MVDFNVLKKDIMDKLNISENEFEELVSNRIKEYGGLLNREASIVVIHREVCRNEDNIKTTEPVHNDENINNNTHTNDEDHNENYNENSGNSINEDNQTNEQVDISSIKTIQLKDIVEKMIEINAIAKIEKIFDEKSVNNSKVVNILINDGTRMGLLSLWNKEIELLQTKHINEGDAILIKNAVCPKIYKNRVHLTVSKGDIFKIESSLHELDEKIKLAREQRYSYDRTRINQLSEGSNAEIRGIIVAIHGSEPYFPVCEKCNKKMILKKGYAICSCGNKVDEESEDLKWLFLCNVVLDDGYGNIRVVLNDNTEALDFDELKKLIIDGEDVRRYLVEELLGIDVIVKGYCVYDNYFQSLIFKSRSWSKTNPLDEFEKLNRKGMEGEQHV
jgi:hypothetical protein